MSCSSNQVNIFFVGYHESHFCDRPILLSIWEHFTLLCEGLYLSALLKTYSDAISWPVFLVVSSFKVERQVPDFLYPLYYLSFTVFRFFLLQNYHNKYTASKIWWLKMLSKILLINIMAEMKSLKKRYKEKRSHYRAKPLLG